MTQAQANKKLNQKEAGPFYKACFLFCPDVPALEKHILFKFSCGYEGFFTKMDISPCPS
jgi:hypothetical protein